VKACRRRRSTTYNSATGGKQVFNFTPRSLYSQERVLVLTEYAAVWDPGPVWMVLEWNVKVHS
jgi:hypothetical protein